jgi:hypothetical protein
VVCIRCSLEETQKAHPDLTNLHAFNHEQGSVVIQVNGVNNAASNRDEDTASRWTSIVKPPQLTVRADESLWQKLLDKEAQSKEVEITGVLRSTRTLDVADLAMK